MVAWKISPIGAKIVDCEVEELLRSIRVLEPPGYEAMVEGDINKLFEIALIGKACS